MQMFCQLVSINAAWGLLRLRRTRLQDVWLSRLETVCFSKQEPTCKTGTTIRTRSLLQPFDRSVLQCVCMARWLLFAVCLFSQRAQILELKTFLIFQEVTML